MQTSINDLIYGAANLQKPRIFSKLFEWTQKNLSLISKKILKQIKY